MALQHTIDFESSTSITAQMKEIIMQRFLDNHSSVKQIPTEYELASEYGVGRMVVQNAIRELCNEGYLYRRPRLGTFVSQKRKTLRIAYYELSHPLYSMDEIISRYSKAFPDTVIEKIKFDSEYDFYGRIHDLVAKDAVDVIKVSERLFNWFKDDPLFSNVNQVFKHFQGDTYSEPWELFKTAKSYHAVPVAFSPVVMAWRKDLFEKYQTAPPFAGWTWQDFKEKAVKLMQSAGQAGCFGFLMPVDINRYSAFLFQNNVNFSVENRNLYGLGEKGAREVLDFLYELITDLKVSSFPINIQGDYTHPFARAEIAMAMISYYDFTRLKSLNPAKWDIVELPQHRCKASLLLADAFAISKKTKDLNTSLEFIEYIMNPEIQGYIAQCRSLVPIRIKSSGKNRSQTPLSYNIYRNIFPSCRKLDFPFRGKDEFRVNDEINMFLHGLQSYEDMCKHLELHLVDLYQPNTSSVGKSVSPKLHFAK